MSRTGRGRAGVSRNEEWEEEENDGRNRERRDKVVERKESDRIQRWEFPKCNHIMPNAQTVIFRRVSALGSTIPLRLTSVL
jgi:hypothetical protein